MEIASGIVGMCCCGGGYSLWHCSGVSRQTDGAAGSAPKKPLLATKVIITSLLALVWAAVYLIIDSDPISFREMLKPFKIKSIIRRR